MGDEDLIGWTIFDAAVLGIAVVDLDGRLRRTNPALQRLLGYTADELLARTFSEITHPDDVAAGLEQFRELIAGHRDSYQLEKRYLRKDGSVIWGRLSVSMRRVAPVVVIGMIEDITAGRAADESRRELVHTLGERVKELTALHQVARIIIDPDRPRHGWLDRVAAILPPAMQYPEITTGCVRVAGETFATAGHATTPWVLGSEFTTADGARGEIEVAYHEPRPEAANGPFLVEESALLASLGGMIRSALDRDHAAERLQEAHDHLNLALRAAGMAVWEWDVDRGIARWSEQLAQMVGFEGPLDGPVRGRMDYIHPDDRQAVLDQMTQVTAGDELIATEARVRRPDGSWRRMLVYARATQASDGSRRVIAAMVDVSVRHALEEGLRQAQKLEALGQVASGVAHDFNNLLAVIIAGAELLQLELGDQQPAGEILEDLCAASQRTVALTRQLLAFSRKAEFQPAAVDLTALVSRLEPVLARLVGSYIKLQVVADGDVGQVWADPTQLEQVVMNLVVNARDAMAEGGVITLATGVTEHQPPADDAKPERFAVISVRDTGPGIPAELRSRIFEPFFTTKEPGKGTGLGLALVMRVARQWHGQVMLDSAPGQGATFRVLLPRLSR